MPRDRERVVIIGAGHNGLVAAFYLAKAGYAPLVLERAEIAGGSAVTDEIHPGFRCPALFDLPGPLLPQIEKDLQLQKEHLFFTPDVQVAALHPDGKVLRIYTDPNRTATDLQSFSAQDARKFPQFHSTLQSLGRVIAPLLSITPPDIDRLDFHDFTNLGKLGLRFKHLDKKDAYSLFRWGPMPVADLVSEWFESELLRAAIAAPGLFGMSAGPRSAGTVVGLLMQAALGTSLPVKGGIGVLTGVLTKAAVAAGAQIRTASGVAGIRIEDRRATGVVLENGEEIPAGAVISNADPRHTFLKLIGPAELDPQFVMKVKAYRARGTVAKVNLALSGLPSCAHLATQIQIGPDTDYLERAFDAAKYGEFSANPFLRITIPSMMDSSLAPKGAHVMSIFVQYAPYHLKSGSWYSRREELGDAVVKTLSAYAPEIGSLIVQRRILTPLDIERRFGMTGGHIFHGEQAFDQLFTFRPLLGWSKYQTPVKGLYLCGSGTHPGGGITGAPGLNASREILKDLG
ncbi:MAG TPA: NAD(P)/FAD-dependent oxidoreductase [Terriglobia bacterium]